MNWHTPFLALALMSAGGSAFGAVDDSPLQLGLPQDDASTVVIKPTAAPLSDTGASGLKLPGGMRMVLRWSDTDTEWRGLTMHMRVSDHTKVMVRFTGRAFIGARYYW